MAAVQFSLPYMVAFKPSGVGVPGAKMFFYAPSTTTKRAVYSSNALTMQLSNPVIADGAGRFPNIYLDNSLTYKIVIYDKSGTGTPLYQADPYIAGQAPDSGSLQPYQDAAAASAASAGSDAAAASASSTSASAAAASAAGSAAAGAAYLASLTTLPTQGLGITAASRGALAVLPTTAPAILTESGREGTFVWSAANNSANVTADTAQGIYVAPSSDATGASGAWVRKFSGPANVKWFGVVGDGSTDDTTAFAKALGAGLPLHIPAGTYIASSISIPSNTAITTAGHATIIKQRAATAAGTRLIKVIGSNVSIGDISVEGQLNQAGDTTGEQNHGIFIALESTSTVSISNISIGNVKGTNIRGDVVYVGSNPAAYTAGYRVSGVNVGMVIGSNVYRNVASVTGGENIALASVTGTQVGQLTFDAEPDAGNGPLTGLRIGYIKGRCAQFASPTAADYIAAWVEHIDLDPSYTTDSSPAYGSTKYQNGLYYQNIKSLRVERLYANGHYGQAIKPLTGALARQQLSFGTVEIPTSCTTEATLNCYIIGDSTTYLTIDNLFATTTLSTHHVLSTVTNAQIGVANIKTVTGSDYMRSCTDCTTGVLNLSTSGAGNGGAVLVSCTRCSVNGGLQAGDTFFSFSTRCVAQNVDATMATSYDNTGTNNVYISAKLGGNFAYLYGVSIGLQIPDTGDVYAPTVYRVGSTQVVSARQTGWAAWTGTGSKATKAVSTATTADCAAAIKSIIDAMMTHGLIGT